MRSRVLCCHEGVNDIITGVDSCALTGLVTKVTLAFHSHPSQFHSQMEQEEGFFRYRVHALALTCIQNCKKIISILYDKCPVSDTVLKLHKTNNHLP